MAQMPVALQQQQQECYTSTPIIFRDSPESPDPSPGIISSPEVGEGSDYDPLQSPAVVEGSVIISMPVAVEESVTSQPVLQPVSQLEHSATAEVTVKAT